MALSQTYMTLLCSYEYGIEMGSTFSLSEQSSAKLQRRLRNVLARKGRLDKDELQWTKQTVWNYSHQLLEWCKRDAEPIRHFEYTGSIYECLEVKSNPQGQCVILAVLKLAKEEVEEEEIVPNLFYRIKESNFECPKFAEFQSGASVFFSAEKTSLWLEELLQAWIDSGAVKEDVKLSCRQFGAYCQLDIKDRLQGGTVSIDLLPCFEIKDADGIAHHFVAKSYGDFVDNGTTPSSLPNPSSLWRHTFAVQERDMLQEMDPRKKSCRHDCVRLVLILFSSDRTLRKFSPYHLKTAFFHFQRTETHWKAEQLATRFLGLLQHIHHCVMKRELLHFFTPRNNLLSDYKEATLQNIQRRLLGITTSEKKLLSCL